MMKQMIRLVWAALLLALTVPAWAGEVETHTLPNGLTVVLKEEHKAPVLSFQVWYRVGSRDEETGRTGLSHMFEHMMFKGTSRYGKGEFARIVAKNGGTENAFTSRDYTAYYENWAPRYLPLSVELESDRMINLLLDPAEFKLENQVVQEERRMRIDDNPSYATIEQLYATAYVVHPYRAPVIGWQRDIERMTRDDAMRHYQAYYNPGNATIVVVGDFDAKDALARITQAFGGLSAKPRPASLVNPEPDQKGEKRLVYRRPAQLPSVFLAYHAPTWESPDAYALAVLAQTLFDGKRSRIYQRLIRGDQSALDAGGEYDPLSRDPELFYFSAAVAPGHTPAEVESAIDQEIERIRTQPISERELERARNQVEAGHWFAQDSVFYQAMSLGEAVTVGAGPDYITRYPERIRQVSAADVMRAAQKYLVADHRTVAVLMPVPPEQDKNSEAGR